MTNPTPSLHADLELGAEERRLELEQARRLAERYRIEFVDMDTFRIDQDLFRSIPADLMLRYAFVPYRREGKHLVIIVSDPSDLPMIDELGVLLNTPIKVMVGARSAIDNILKKSESSQRVLEEATESFQLQLLKEEENGDESLTVERLTSDISPVIRLVDSTIYTAIQRRASDIHIETLSNHLQIRFRIDGVLGEAQLGELQTVCNQSAREIVSPPRIRSSTSSSSSPSPRSTNRSATRSRRTCGPSFGTIRRSSWSARSATRKRPRWPSVPPRPGTCCSARCTPTPPLPR